jgi:hypothetical protein
MKEPLDLSRLTQRDYGRFLLGGNPFPSIAVAEENPILLVDRKPVMDAIKDTITACYTSGKSRTMVIQGVYGSGKSHVLRYTKSRINSQLGSSKERKTVAVYVESPLSSFRGLYSEILEDLGEDFVRALAYGMVAKFVNSGDGALEGIVIPQDSDGTLKNKIRTGLNSDPSYFNDLISRGLVRHLDLFNRMVKAYSQEFKVTDYFKVFLRMTDPVVESASWQWLTGEELNRHERDILDVQGSLEEERGLDAFHDLKRILALNGYPMIFILQDELEKITELHFSLKSRYFDDLRHFVDANTDGMCLIACVTPAGFSELEASGHPLYRRLLASNFTLVPFDTSLTEELIKAYVLLSRQEYLRSTGKTPEDLSREITARNGDPDLYPFDRAVIDPIRDASLGNIGEILTNCRKLIDSACDDSSITKIDSIPFVTSIISPPQVEV